MEQSQAPLLSILMPVRNASPWLDECLNSIYDQDFSNWELLIVDDNSTDNSLEILERHAWKSERIRIFQTSSFGIISALRKALQESRGTYIHRMDADDIMPPMKLSSLMTIALKSDRVIATGKVRYFNDTRVSGGYRKYEQWLNERCDENDHWKWLYRECVVASANWITHRKNIQWDDLRYPEDYHAVFNWYQLDLKIESVDRITHLWREHSLRTSRNSFHYNQESFFNLKIDHFLSLHHEEKRPVVLLGKNVKSDLCQTIFKSRKVDYTVLEKHELNRLDILKGCRILVAVYPPYEDRKSLVSYLNQRGLYMGMDWWWL